MHAHIGVQPYQPVGIADILARHGEYLETEARGLVAVILGRRKVTFAIVQKIPDLEIAGRINACLAEIENGIEWLVMDEGQGNIEARAIDEEILSVYFGVCQR